MSTLEDPSSVGAIERLSIRRNVAVMTSSQMLGWVLATVGSVLVPRYLGPVILGQFQLAGALWAIAGVFTTLGTSMYLQLEIARNQRDGLALMKPVFVLRTGAFLMASLVMAVYVAVSDADATFAGFVALFGVTALFGLWTAVYFDAFMGLERMSSVAAVGAIFRFVGLAGTVLVLVLGLGAFGVLGFGVAGSLAWMITIALQFRRLRVPRSTAWASKLKRVLVGSSPFMATGLALVMYRQVDTIVISSVAGARDLGWYSAADTLFGSLLFPTTIILAAVFPTFGRLHKTDREGLHELVRRTFALLIVVSVPIGLGAAVVGPTFAPLLFGDRFSGTGPLLAIFGPVTILTFGTTFLASVCMATGRSRFVSGVLFAMAAATIPLDIVLVPWAADRFDNGAIGGALAFLVTESIQFALMLWRIAPYIVTSDWVWRTFRVLLAGGLMVAAVWPLRDVLFVLPVLVGAAVYMVAVWALRVPDQYQRSLLRGAVARVVPSRRRIDPDAPES